MSISLSFLGGLGEIGRNCAVLEIGGRLAVIDCGLMFPEEDMLGVDLVLPDFSWVVERAPDVDLVVLTHGHEDHVGALGYLLRELNSVPVYGTPLTIALARSRVEELEVEAEFVALGDGEWVEQGPFRFMLVPVSHSIPQGAAIAFDTPQGIILHSGDFKLDPTPIDGRSTDLQALGALGRQGVRLLLSDSTNAEVPGFVPSESSLSGPLYEIISAAPGRVIAACFSSHLHRVQQIVDAGLDDGRQVALLGRSMLRNVQSAIELELLEIPEDRLIPIEEIGKHRPDEVLVVCTGSQGEPFSALSLMANGDHRFVDVGENDTMLISATPIPGNETKVARVINGLLRREARVFHGRNSQVHVSGHAAREELLTFINLVRPQAFVPIHGEYRHLKAHAELAESLHVADIVVCEDGDRVVLEGSETRVERRAVPGGFVYLDGETVGGVARSLLRDRRHLADEGVMVVTVGIDHQSGELVEGPEVYSHGIMDDPKFLHESVAKAITKLIAGHKKGATDPTAVRQRLYETTRRVVREEASRRPVVLPVILEL